MSKALKNKVKLNDVVDVVADYGADPSGVADSTSAFNNALASGKDVYVPTGTFLVSGTLTMNTPFQKLYGNGMLSVIKFTFASSLPGIVITNSTGWQAVRNLFLWATTNVTKVISVGAPDVTIQGCRIYQQTATGHGIYLEDENTGSGIYDFDCHILDNYIAGTRQAGTYGVRLGNNCQCFKIVGNSIQQWGNMIYVNGACTNGLIQANILQASELAAATAAAIYINRTGSAMAVYTVSIINNYFEQNQVCVLVDDCAVNDLQISNNYAYRNTVTKATAYFYNLGANNSAASQNISIDNNFIEDYGIFLGLGNQYGARLISCKGNTMKTVTSYSAGTYLELAYNIRTINSYYNRRIISGAFLSEAVNRLEAKTCVYQVPIQWEPHEYLTQVTCNFVQVGTSVTVELHKVTSNGNTDTIVATSGLISTDQIITIPVGAYADGLYNYYMQVTYNGLGTTAYVYPFRLFLQI